MIPALIVFGVIVGLALLGLAVCENTPGTGTAAFPGGGDQ